jgi:hypothetical protein
VHELSCWPLGCPGKLCHGNSEPLHSMKDMLKERLPLNFILMKFKEIWSEKRWDVLLFNRIVCIFVSCF